MFKKLLLISLLLNICSFTYGQIALTSYKGIEISRNGELMKNPWAGGFNSPQFSVADLNGDGLKDLVAFERNFYGSVKTFLRQPSGNEIDYVHDPYYQTAFPPLRNWMLLRDYNCDGREDIFSSVPGGIAVYRNDLTPETGMKFTQVTSLLLTVGLNGTTPLYVAPTDIPSVTDIDGDGDLDILAFNIIGNTLEYHKNLSVENTGSCEELSFELRNACWGFFSEDGNNNTVTLFDTCEVNVGDPEKNSRHAGSTVLAIDLTGNGVKDLLLGDITYNNLVRLTNGGSQTSSIMTEQFTNFPSGSLPVDLNVFPAAYYIDVNDDGRKDLLVSPNNPNNSENYNNIWLYMNEGTAEVPDFIFSGKDFLQGGMIDLGEGSFPAFFDANGDGLLDIVSGNRGYYAGTAAYESRLLLLQNTGNAAEPEFEYVTDDYAGLSTYGFDGVYPSFGDMDNDGDQDMIIGDEQGRLHYFDNQQSTGVAQFKLMQANYFDIDVGEAAKPQIVDVNNDGRPDLLLGERSGTLKYYENTGSLENAFFGSTASNDFFGGVDVMPPCCTGFSAPFLTTDSLGSKILYVGSEQGYLYLYNDIEGNLAGNFRLVDSLYLHGVNINLCGADINLDGKQEFVYGAFSGGIALLRDGEAPVFGLREVNMISGPEMHLYPNPAASVLNIDFVQKINTTDWQINIYDIYGRHLINSGMIEKSTQIDVQKLPAGVYVVVAGNKRQRSIKKFIKR